MICSAFAFAFSPLPGFDTYVMPAVHEPSGAASAGKYFSSAARPRPAADAELLMPCREDFLVLPVFPLTVGEIVLALRAFPAPPPLLVFPGAAKYKFCPMPSRSPHLSSVDLLGPLEVHLLYMSPSASSPMNLLFHVSFSAFTNPGHAA